MARSFLRQTQRDLYFAQRTLGDFNTATGKDGGKRLLKRVARRYATRTIAGWLGNGRRR